MAFASATPADKFQLSWIRSTLLGPAAVVNNEESNVEPSVAILSKNRYGREEVLQLHPRPIRVPFGLSNCPIFVQEARGPTVMMQMSEIEQRLQMNINSSKAMSALNPTERNMVASGGSPNGLNSPQPQKTMKNEWTPVKSTSNWGRGAATSAGGPTATMNGRGGLTRSLGRGTPLGQPEEIGTSPYGQKYVLRGRGGTIVGRGQSVAATSAQFNPRAQGLYDPRDPKDRPRNRLRSTSDDTDPSSTPTGQDENGGWTGSRFGRQNSSAWSKDENSWNQSSDRESSFTTVQKQEIGEGNMPEWFENADYSKKPLEPNAGSFDDDGRYRKDHEQTAPRWRPGQQDQPQHHSPDEPNFPPHRYVPPEVLAAQPGAPPQVDYFYLDPTEVERGPFQKEQMYTWYQMNYFADTLKVRTSENTEWKTLGELKVANGAAKPFDYKPPAPPAVQPSFSYPGNASFGGNLFGGSSPWGEMFAGAPSAAASGGVASAFDDKSMLAEKQRFEMQKMQELMRVAQEQKRISELKELEYRRQQEELRQKFEEEMLRKQMEQRELQKKLESLESEKNARLMEERRRMEEEMKRVEEKRQKEQAELKRLEEEKRRVLDEAKKHEMELKKKEEEIERKRHADRAAEEHRQLMIKKAGEDALRIRQAQAEARRVEEERKAAKDAERMFNNEVVWNTSKPSTPAENMESPWQTAPSKKSPPQKPKIAPWSSSVQSAPREKTLREIQKEEERMQQAEARELARQRKEQESSNTCSPVQSALWSNANQRINWVANTAPIVAKAPGKPAWGGAGVDSRPPVSTINWDGPSLQAANKVAPTPASALKKAASAAPLKPTSNIKTASKTQAVDIFTQWVTKRLKDINKNVDADVLSSFLESVENPNEVEDYVQEYLGESKVAKEFVKEYLQKRCESRKRQETDKDDLSCARYAGTGTSGTQGKKKKGKGARLVVDGSCLGFRATGDPNRVNQGEIETVPLSSGQKR